MDFGVMKQKGAPQEVYDEPTNLFSAKFLGTPPINLFEGTVSANKIKLGKAVLGSTDAKSQDVIIGIRPEGFRVDPKGPLKLIVEFVETIGRDTTLLVIDPTEENKRFRAIIDADYKVEAGDEIRLSVKPHKMFIFDPETGEKL
jgi:multiple sugar transport system ATP-binding protein